MSEQGEKRRRTESEPVTESEASATPIKPTKEESPSKIVVVNIYVSHDSHTIVFDYDEFQTIQVKNALPLSDEKKVVKKAESHNIKDLFNASWHKDDFYERHFNALHSLVQEIDEYVMYLKNEEYIKNSSDIMDLDSHNIAFSSFLDWFPERGCGKLQWLNEASYVLTNNNCHHIKFDPKEEIVMEMFYKMYE
jgi:hypothetical protein